MNATMLRIAVLAAALALAPACSKKPPREIPPGPIGSEETPGTERTGETETGGVGTEVLPGSRADFLQNVGSDRIFFDTDSHVVDDEDRSVLEAQAAWLLRNPNVRVTIEGHCDERGTREYNLALGDRRANAAKNYLAARGVEESRMTVISWGKERPEALGSDEDSWRQNRRAVTVLPN